ncbi:tape measure protein [Bifidobacterium sp. 82T10]|uniref:Tape measure protein n=1 Tax=Bifidobacterium miconis TaxID=2834435 RepID=A0ABS6WGD1_9BIFI|nr:tape measure protein [Bifidobacterium miconis]MBW3093114.1 tape measure protein [Bifidobacterium miconis]
MAGGYQLATAYVAVVPSMKGVGKAIEAAFEGPAKSTGRKSGETAGSGFSSGFGAKLGVVSGVASSIASKVINVFSGLSGQIMDASDSTQKFAQTLQFAGVSDGQIRKLTASTQDYANRTVYGIDDIRNTTAQLAANGVPNYDKLAEAAGNLNAVAGGNANTFKSVAMMLTQTAGAGKLTTENWNQLSDAIPGASGKLQEAMLKNGAYTGNFRDAMAKGEITADEFNKALMGLGMTDVAKQAAESTSTFEGAFGNLEATIVDGSAQIVNTIKPMLTGAVTIVGDKAGAALAWVNDAVSGTVSLIAQGDFTGAFRKAFHVEEDNPVVDLILRVRNAFIGLRDLIAKGDFTGVLRSAFNVEEDSPLVDAILKARDAVIDLWNTVREKLAGLGQSASGWVQPLTDALFGLAELDLTIFANAVQFAADALKWFLDNGAIVTSIIAGLGGAFATLKIGQGITAGITTFRNLGAAASLAFDAIKSGNGVFATISDAIGLLDPKAGGLLSNLGGIAGKLAGLQKAATEAGGGIRGLSTALGLGPWGLVVAGIATVVAGLVWFFTQTETGRQMWSSFTSWLSETWTGLVEGAKALWNGLGEFFTGLWGSITGGVQTAWNGVTAFFTGLWTSISLGVSTAWNGITTFLTGVWTGIVATATTIFTNVQTAIVNVFTVLGALIVAPLQAIQTGISTVFGWILSFITQQMNSTNAVWSTVWAAIYTVVSTVFGLIQGFISTVVNAIRTIIVVFLDLLKGDWSGAWNEIKSFFTTTWNGIKSFLSTILAGIKSVWTTVWTAVSQFFTNVWNGIVKFFTPIINGIKTTITSVLNAIKSVWTSIWNAIKSVASSIWNAISSTVSSCINKVRGTITSVLNAIQSVWNSVWTAVGSFLSRIWNGITQAVSNGIRTVSNTVGRIKSTVLGAVSGAGRWLYDTGRQIISGLIDGIGGAMSWLKTTISNLGSSVLNWAKSVLHIHSPSRVFRDQVGRWIPAGMAQGIDEASGLVEDSINGLTGMLPTISLKTDTSRLDAMSAYRPLIADGRVSYTMENRTANYATKQDIIDAIDAALAAGITLNLNDRGGEVMAGKLAKPMAYELDTLTRLGR